jgi:hypothetical protein
MGHKVHFRLSQSRKRGPGIFLSFGQRRSGGGTCALR